MLKNSFSCFIAAFTIMVFLSSSIVASDYHLYNSTQFQRKCSAYDEPQATPEIDYQFRKQFFAAGDQKININDEFKEGSSVKIEKEKDINPGFQKDSEEKVNLYSKPPLNKKIIVMQVIAGALVSAISFGLAYGYGKSVCRESDSPSVCAATVSYYLMFLSPIPLSLTVYGIGSIDKNVSGEYLYTIMMAYAFFGLGVVVGILPAKAAHTPGGRAAAIAVTASAFSLVASIVAFNSTRRYISTSALSMENESLSLSIPLPYIAVENIKGYQEKSELNYSLYFNIFSMTF